MEITKRIEPTHIAELREWYTMHATTEKEIWVAVSRSKTQQNGISYLDAVEEALCFGWIDSTTKSIGEQRYQRFSPRRPKSDWTELNKERCRRLIRLGRMTPAGEKTLPSLAMDSFQPADWILEALQEDPVVWQQFQQLPPLYVRIKLYNIQFEEKKKRHDSALLRLRKFIDATREGKLYGEWNDDGRLLEDTTQPK